jgi:hypothetical protein
MPWFTHRAFKRKRALSLRCALLFAGTGMLLLSSSALAYNFTYFGGRLGRPGVDSRYFMCSWNRGPTGGTLTWFLLRGELTYQQCDGACFGTLNNLVPPELAKWALWIDLTFAQAADSASADVVIRFTTATSTADALASQWVGNTLTQCLIRINPNQFINWSSPGAQADFSFAILHEWGHCLGLGDLYWVNHGVNTFEAEDFTDHVPSPALPNPQGKGDNVMETYGVMVLDNDEIYGAQWLWGNIGANAITTGDLQTRVPGDNANQAAPHHGPPTWTYRGTVWNTQGPTVASVRFPNICLASSIGPGVWNIDFFPDRIEWTVPGPYQGNFIFQISDTLPGGSEGGNVATVGTTNFNAPPPPPPPPPPQQPPPGWPGWPGPRLFPHPGVFGVYGQCRTDIVVTDAPRLGYPVSIGPVSTCGWGDDCDLRPGEDCVIQVVVDSAGPYTFSLCGAALWDTYIYLFEDYCRGDIIASNDDGCGVAAGASVITCQYLEPGTYYLDIEPATSGPCGDFTLTVSACSTGRCCYGDPQNPTCLVLTRLECDSLQGTWNGTLTCDTACPPRPGCPADTSLFAHYPHLPEEAWSGLLSEASQGYRAYENYLVEIDIRDFHFWGVNLRSSPFGACSEDPMPFSIGFFPDSAGFPASNSIRTYSLSLSSTATGLQYLLLGSAFEMLYYSTDLTPPCGLLSGWVSVQGAGNPDCRFLWISSPIGNGASCQWEDSYSDYNTVPFDLAVCLTAPPCDTAIRADSVTIRLNTANTNLEIRFRAPVAGEYTVWSTSDKNAVYPASFIPEATVTAATGLNSWTDLSAVVGYKRYVITHTCPSLALNQPVRLPIHRPFGVRVPSDPGKGSVLPHP